MRYLFNRHADRKRMPMIFPPESCESSPLSLPVAGHTPGIFAASAAPGPKQAKSMGTFKTGVSAPLPPGRNLR